MIKAAQESDIKGLNTLSPKDWNFDYEAFLTDFMHEEYFHAFLQYEGKKIIGTGNVFIHEKIGWLANIIIDEKHRTKGNGSTMTQFLVDFLKEKKCETQVLIATKLGEPVYKKLGFKKISEYQSFESEINLNYTATDSIRGLKKSDMKNVYKLDELITGEIRPLLIEKCSKNGFGYFNDEDELQGVFLPRFGKGLVLATNKKAGQSLLKFKHSKKGRKSYIPIENTAGIAWMEHLDLKKGEPFSRMILGKKDEWKPTMIYSYGSGYCG